MNKKHGKLVEFEGVKMQSHEKDTVLRLRKLGLNAKPVLPTGTSRTPDVVIGNQLWEIKSPEGNSKKSTIESQFKRAKKQSKYLIIDCARTKLSDKFVEKETYKQLNFPEIKHLIKKVKIITKKLKIVDLVK
ncbi:MAG: hypothetical protein LBK50_02955 [Candidatus Nomurabacteria bacterium]|jgi:hypothetical protein|nr:hypothetical protein [Candidatus Nomurabacteria bacterium]